MGNLTIAATFVIMLNVLMFLGQAAVLDINPEGPEYFHCEGSTLDTFGSGCDSLVLDTEDIANDLPTAEGSISPTTGNIFTDTFSSIKTWFGQTLGLNYVYGILAAPYNILKTMSLPAAFVYAVGTLWYGVSLLIVISFFWGRE